MNPEQQKKLMYEAGKKSLEFIPKDAEVIVFGAGRTVCQALQAFVDQKLNEKISIACASQGTKDFAQSLGITVKELNFLKNKKYTYIDGADQIDPEKNLIKGGFKNLGDPGKEGCMKKEKELAYGCESFIVIADNSKLVKVLGENNYAIPIEIEVEKENNIIEELKVKEYNNFSIRKKPNKDVFVTENNNHIIDLIVNLQDKNITDFEKELGQLQGAVANGIFSLKKPEKIIISSEKGISLL
jgi:ribose 5-phosphate isomerase A